MRGIFKDNFITKANDVHGNKYDYSLVDYINNKTKVKIICKKHGIFNMNPNSHTSSKQGCPLCGIKKRSTQNMIPEKMFLTKSFELHGNKYNYDNANYTGIKNKVLLTCNICGDEFKQIAYNHIHGSGCRRCLNMKKSTTVDFIKKSIEKHKNKFDYSLVNYINCMEKIIIKCNKCLKSFAQRPNDHLDGHGCPHCAKIFPLDTSSFILRCLKIHKNKYDYKNVSYTNNFTKVQIICKKCNQIFSQQPSHHLGGHGCPSCFSKLYRISKGEVEFLDKMKIKDRQIFFGKLCVDGYESSTKTAYEFLGDYYHGNPSIFDSNAFNKTCKRTFGELYINTFKKFKKLKSRGIQVIYIWENEWNDFKNKKLLKIPIKKY